MKAAENGNAVAADDLGLMYQYGRGVEVDLTTAAQWYLKGAQCGSVDAMRHLAILYEYELETPDYASAMAWFLMAAEHGNVSSMNEVGLLYECGRGVEPDLAKAAEYYRMALEVGLEEAQGPLDRVLKQK